MAWFRWPLVALVLVIAAAGAAVAGGVPGQRGPGADAAAVGAPAGSSGGPARRVGVYSGTFDPPHAGHLRLGLEAVARLGLSRVWLLPNPAPDHKPGATPFAVRWTMASLACRRHPCLCLPPRAVFSAALAAPDGDVTGALLAWVRRQEGAATHLYQLCGADSFAKLLAYGKEPLEGENRIIVVFPRKNTIFPTGLRVAALRQRGQLVTMTSAADGLSSTALRATFARGAVPQPDELPPWLVPCCRENRLYGARWRGLWPGGLLSSLPAELAVGVVPGPSLPGLLAGLGGPTGASITGATSGTAVAATTAAAAGQAAVGAVQDPGLSRLRLSRLVPLTALDGPSTLDVDAYLAGRLASFVRRLVLEHGAGLTLVGGPAEAGVSALAARGWAGALWLRPRGAGRIGLHYLVGWRDGRPQLAVCNVLGRVRLQHVALQLATLLRWHGLPLERLAVGQVPGQLIEPVTRLAATAFAGWRFGPRDLVAIGYRGAWGHTIAAWNRATAAHSRQVRGRSRDRSRDRSRGRSQGPDCSQNQRQDRDRGQTGAGPGCLAAEAVARADLAAVAARVAAGSLAAGPDTPGDGPAEGEDGGNPLFPFRVWRLADPGGGRPWRVLGLRNAYGEQTGVVVRELLARGARRFVLFGNAGGLSARAGRGSLLAPVLLTGQAGTVTWENRAAAHWPRACVLTVPSVLVESQAWLRRARGYDLVEVENHHAARSLQGRRDVWLFAGLLVSDRPGEAHDITAKDEDEAGFIAAKRRFISTALRCALAP